MLARSVYAARHARKRSAVLLALLCAAAMVLAAAVTAATWSGAGAQVAQPRIAVPIGQISATLSDVRNVEGTGPLAGRPPQEVAAEVTCVRYSPQGAGYSTGTVTGASGQYAAVGYGTDSDSCPIGYRGESPNGLQSSMGFLPGPSAAVDAGDVFLVGTLRHYNTDVTTFGDDVTNPGKETGPGTTYYGDLEISMAGGEIREKFPWKEIDTSNSQCYTQLDENGEITLGEAPDAPTKYAADASGNIGPASVDGPYKYAFNAQGRVDTRKAVRYDFSIGGLTFGKGRGYYDKKGRDCTVDHLTIASDRSTTSWTDPGTGIRYKLRLWGLVNNGANATCKVSSDVATAALEGRFLTQEGGKTTYGCLYGSLEQVRPVTLKKEVDAADSLRASTAIPSFSFSNVSAPGTWGAQSWGTPSALKPTGWGEAGAATDPRRYELLTPNDAATLKEEAASPAYSPTRSGWRLTAVTCTNGSDKKPLMRKDGQRLDQSGAVDLAAGTLRLDEAELARSLDDAAITCTWHNEYVANFHLTLVNKVDGGSATPGQWTLTATRAQGGGAPITGTTGSAAVTNARVTSGSYILSTSTVEGYGGAEWSCVNTATSQPVPVKDSQVSMPANARVTCTATQRPAARSLSFSKVITGASDGTDRTAFQVAYSCAKPGGAPVSGTATVTSGGNRVESNPVPVGATCTVTEEPLKDAWLKAPGSGAFSWSAPVGFHVSDDAVDVPTAPAAGNADRGASFTVPAGTGPVNVGITNALAAHAGVTKTFEGSARAEDVNGLPSYDQTYRVMVTNPSTTTALTYSLTDAPTAPAGTTINSVRISGGPLAAPVEARAPAFSYRSGEVELAAGATHAYTVVVNVTAPDAGLPGIGAGGTCDATAVDGGKAVRNEAGVTTKGDADAVRASACGIVPATPRFAVSKTGTEVVRGADGSFTAGYAVTITNTSQVASRIVEDVVDTPAFPAGATISSITVSEAGAVTSTSGAVPAGGSVTLAAKNTGGELAAAPAPGGKGGGRVLTVQVAFTVDPNAQGYTASDYACGATRADGKPSGLVNAVSMTGDTDGGSNNTGCVSAKERLAFSKAVESEASGQGGALHVSYRISVVNMGALPSSTGRVLDRPDFAPGLRITGATLAEGAGAAPVPVAAQGDGSYEITSGRSVAPGETATWILTFNVTVDPGAADYDESALACSKDGAGAFVSKHGLLNLLGFEAGKDNAGKSGDEAACSSVSPDAGKRALTIVKTGSQGNLAGAAFDIYPSDPSAPGAAKIADGVVDAGGDRGVFTTAPLAVNREYWLVETRAPAGHQLLASPVRIRVTDTDITVLNGNELGVSTAVASASDAAAGITNTLTIKDIETASLPLSGGHGIIPNALVAVLVIGAACTLVMFSFIRRRNASR
ncbi:DUF5979 domain-containing protein [Actinomyces timonensis]|uniref:DUF5979 domain-containing protein n=1 Tax=Actinomyces timonensis TaxID=1288391 RepID=A0AAU8N2M6_9ACTO